MSLFVVALILLGAIGLVPCDGCASRLLRCNESDELLLTHKTFVNDLEWRSSLLRRLESAIKSIEFVDPAKNEYGLIVDAGSTHSEVMLFTWSGKFNGTGFVRQISDCDVDTGIDDDVSLNHTVSALKKCFAELAGKIPGNQTTPLPVLLGATAGMRILNLTDSSRAEKVLSTIRSSLDQASVASRKLALHKARILSGTEEGEYAWITANYLMKSIPHEAVSPYAKRLRPGSIGIVDMGGASSQIAYKTSWWPDDQVRLFGQSYKVRAYSNLCLGTDEALMRYRLLLLMNRQDKTNTTLVDPCMALDDDPVKIEGTEFQKSPCLATFKPLADFNVSYTFVGSIDPGLCRRLTSHLTDYYACKRHFKICHKIDYHSKRSTIYYAISSYYYTFRVLPSMVKGRSSFPDEACLLEEIDFWCRQPAAYRVDKAGKFFSSLLCFRQNLAFNNLRNVYRLSRRTWPRIFFVKKIANASVGWGLGFMLRESNLLPDQGGKNIEISRFNVAGLEKVYQMANNLTIRVENSNKNLADEESELAEICEDISNSLNADLFFHYQKCGTKYMETDCCRPRFGLWK